MNVAAEQRLGTLEHVLHEVALRVFLVGKAVAQRFPMPPMTAPFPHGHDDADAAPVEPVACTLDYSPVCAQKDNGLRCITTPRPSMDEVTYGNACADPDVYGYVPGECQNEKATG